MGTTLQRVSLRLPPPTSKAEEKQNSAGRWRRSRMVEARGEFLTEASDAIMEECYMKASDNNTLSAHARQIFYVARPLLEERTERAVKYDYFSQTLLTAYFKNHKEKTADWDVVYDDRGHFLEPHSGRVIGLGTLAVRRYLGRVTKVTIRHCLMTASCLVCPPNADIGSAFHGWSYHAW
jgi:AAA+ ATPase superfamily predicted ATPase